MSAIRLTIRGLIFALFPHYDKEAPNSEEMVQQAVDRLRELDETRPEIILMPEPENIHDPKAIRAWCGGSSIGYVAHEETSDGLQLFDSSREMVIASIVEVEVRRKGNFYVMAELPEGSVLKPRTVTDPTSAWKHWRCNVPKLGMPDTWKDCRVLEFQIRRIFEKPEEAQLKNLRNYIKVWTDKSLHDFSVDAMQLRERYMEQLRAIGNGTMEAHAKRLGRQYSAICSGQRMTYRMKWWKELRQSRQMAHYWDKWRSGRKEDDLWKDLRTVDLQLRQMPDGLYAHIGDLTCLFSALRYRDDVSRNVLWDIYTLLLLRERICRELDIPMEPLPENAYGVEPDEDEEDVRHPELTDARLAKAVEEHQMYFWGKSAYAVVFCVCRDYFGIAGNVSAFEKRIQSLNHSREVEECPTGTIQKALGNNDYMKKHISKWEEGRALKLATKLRAFLSEVS